MSEHQVELRFQHGQAGVEEIQGVVDDVLATLADPRSTAAELARAAGADAERWAKATITVVEEQQGFDPLTTTILVTIAANAGTHIAKRFWDDVVWPRIKARIGADAIGDNA